MGQLETAAISLRGLEHLNLEAATRLANFNGSIHLRDRIQHAVSYETGRVLGKIRSRLQFWTHSRDPQRSGLPGPQTKMGPLVGLASNPLS